MLLWLAASSFCARAVLSSVQLNVTDQGANVFAQQLKPGETASFDLNENYTLKLELSTTFSTPPKSHAVVFEGGAHSVSFPLSFRQGRLSIVFTPHKLYRLYKHAGSYNIRVMVADPSMDRPIFWHVAVVNYITENEVVDDFTDVEWDFQPPPRTPSAFVTRVFTLVMFVPFGVLMVLLLANGCNLGYFPRSIEALWSLLFVSGLAGFFAFFIYFWRYVTFEEMFKYLLVIVPVLGILLRGALVGRAKMAAKLHNE